MLELSEETFRCDAYNKRYCKVTLHLLIYVYAYLYYDSLFTLTLSSSRNLDLYATEIKEVTAVNEISSMYERWTYDGRFTGLNPILRPLECKNISGSSCMAQAFSNLGTVHLFWERLPSLEDEQYGLEKMNGDAFYAMINSG